MKHCLFSQFFTLLTIFHIHRREPFKISSFKSQVWDVGDSPKWHHKYSWHHTKIFGFITCRTTSKFTGIGAAECGWGDCKEIKSVKWSHISSSNLMKKSTLYTASFLHQAQIKQKEYEKLNCSSKYASWGDEDEDFDLDIEK